MARRSIVVLLAVGLPWLAGTVAAGQRLKSDPRREAALELLARAELLARRPGWIGLADMDLRLGVASAFEAAGETARAREIVPAGLGLRALLAPHGAGIRLVVYQRLAEHHARMGRDAEVERIETREGTAPSWRSSSLRGSPATAITSPRAVSPIRSSSRPCISTACCGSV